MDGTNQGGQVAKILALARHLQEVAASGKNLGLIIEIAQDIIIESDTLCKLCREDLFKKKI